MKRSPSADYAFNDILPVAFVFEPIQISGIKRANPCDTGAYFCGLYEDFIGENDLKDWSIGNSLSSIREFIHRFYKTNENYLEGKLPDLGSFDEKYRDFYNFASAFIASARERDDNHSGTPDDRSTTIEVQVSRKILITKSLRAVFGSNHFIGKITDLFPNIFDETTGVYFDSYPQRSDQKGTYSDYYVGALVRCMQDFLKRHKLIRKEDYE